MRLKKIISILSLLNLLIVNTYADGHDCHGRRGGHHHGWGRDHGDHCRHRDCPSCPECPACVQQPCPQCPTNPTCSLRSSIDICPCSTTKGTLDARKTITTADGSTVTIKVDFNYRSFIATYLEWLTQSPSSDIQNAISSGSLKIWANAEELTSITLLVATDYPQCGKCKQWQIRGTAYRMNQDFIITLLSENSAIMIAEVVARRVQ